MFRPSNIKPYIYKTLLILSFSVITIANAEIRVRPSEWAQPIIGIELENFYTINSKVYRSEQPDDDEFTELEKFGIKEVLNLRHYHSDKDNAENTNLILHHIKTDAGSINDKQILKALRIIKNAKGPILIHCWHGSDRTGIIAAMYRIVFQDWPKEKAIDELVNGGYGYHKRTYPSIIEKIRSADIEWYKEKLCVIVYELDATRNI